ncbi:MAG TPA: XRE family transcriptional regulator [Candidatus Binataceae bacterium]|nr:XRE family transcriptional regulator [Candidatus Binataceae bacterium]
MLSETLENGLRQYAVGEKLRTLRLRKKMSLVQLGRHTGLSAALLSKIERGLMFPTLPTLLRTALVFGIGLDFFFSDPRTRHALGVVRRRERLRFVPPEKGAAYRFECLDFAAVERKLNAYYAEFDAQSARKAASHQHDGAEFIYVISGSLGLSVGANDIAVHEGDAIYFDASVSHSYRRLGRALCSAVVVTVP